MQCFFFPCSSENTISLDLVNYLFFCLSLNRLLSQLAPRSITASIANLLLSNSPSSISHASLRPNRCIRAAKELYFLLP
jgi:hypothetical protein